MPRTVESVASLTKKKKTLKLSIFEHELVSMEGIEEELICTREEIEEWKRKVEGLEEKKRELVKEMNEALKEKDECLKEKDQEIAKLSEQNQELFHHISALEERLREVGCTGKKLGELSSRQRSRRLKELKGRAQVALWFLKSCGLELTCLKVVDTKHGKPYIIDPNTALQRCQVLMRKMMINWNRSSICWTSFVPVMSFIMS